VHRLHILQRLSGKYLFKLLGKANEKFQPLESYCIRKGYHYASNAGNFNDTSNTDEWQKEVYLFAARFMLQHNLQRVVDVGCGSAYKLIHLLKGFDNTGIEVASTYQWLKKKYPSGKWLMMGATPPGDLKTDLVLCSDVIEHVPDPDKLLQYIISIRSRYIIFSTPERDAVAGTNDYGPPENSTHYREWNKTEFKEYISKWLLVEEQHIFPGKSVSQVIVCSKIKN
jgi:SAM-dependent methyltransferase